MSSKPSIIKTVKDSIKIPLAHIGNLSFDTGIFPIELRIAKFVPIFKYGDDCVLPIINQGQRYLYFQKSWKDDLLISYILKQKILFEYQFGFQKGKSTHMALITLVDKVTEALDNGDYVVGVFLDFSKAVGTVDHSIILDKMFIYGVQNVALNNL